MKKKTEDGLGWRRLTWITNTENEKFKVTAKSNMAPLSTRYWTKSLNQR